MVACVHTWYVSCCKVRTKSAQFQRLSTFVSKQPARKKKPYTHIPEDVVFLRNLSLSQHDQSVTFVLTPNTNLPDCHSAACLCCKSII